MDTTRKSNLKSGMNKMATTAKKTTNVRGTKPATKTLTPLQKRAAMLVEAQKLAEKALHLQEAAAELVKPTSCSVLVYAEAPKLFKVGTKGTLTARIIAYVKSVQDREVELFDHDTVKRALHTQAYKKGLHIQHKVWIGKAFIRITFIG
jgi:hypothetical protein